MSDEATPPFPSQPPTGPVIGLVFHQNGSAWEKVSIGDEWVAQIHHPKGSRYWNIHFREEIPPETYATRKACIAALKTRFAIGLEES